jgi:hypothetical protein
MVKDRNINKLILLLLIAVEGLGLISCNKDEEIDTSVGDPIQSVTPTIEISSFFDSAWTHLGDGSPKSFFPNNRQDVCALVNSDEEFRELYQGTDEIPYIDFQQYTLVIGKKKYYTKDGEKNPTQFEGQKLYLMDGKYVLDLSCRYNVSGVTFYSDRFICFWGLYPKLSPKDIMVKIQYVD